nr:hypothetical protein GCM10020093_096590 [Planobispora longispora]
MRRLERLTGQRRAAAAQIEETVRLIAELETRLAEEEHDVSRLEEGVSRRSWRA